MSQSNAADSNSCEVIPDSESSLVGVDSIGNFAKESSEIGDSNTSGEYERLKRQLLVVTLVASVSISILIALFYPLNIVVNYAIGSVVGLVYVRMLGRGVARLSSVNKNMGSSSRFALFAGLIIVAARVNYLSVLPVFLGFMTYKVALFVYAFQTLVSSRNSKAP